MHLRSYPSEQAWQGCCHWVLLLPFIEPNVGCGVSCKAVSDPIPSSWMPPPPLGSTPLDPALFLDLPSAGPHHPCVSNWTTTLPTPPPPPPPSLRSSMWHLHLPTAMDWYSSAGLLWLPTHAVCRHPRPLVVQSSNPPPPRHACRLAYDYLLAHDC